MRKTLTRLTPHCSENEAWSTFRRLVGRIPTISETIRLSATLTTVDVGAR